MTLLHHIASTNSAGLLCTSCTQTSFYQQASGSESSQPSCISADDVEMDERYCSTQDEVCLTEVIFVTSTFEVARVSRRCSKKTSDDACQAVNIQGSHNHCHFKLQIGTKQFIVECPQHSTINCFVPIWS